MILDSLANAAAYARLAPRLDAGFRFLRNTDLRATPAGRIEIAGPEVFAILQDYDTKPVEQGFFESHRKHIDIQYMVSGAERMGWAPIDTLRVTDPFDDAKDLIKYAGAGEWVTVREGMFTIFFPTDGHMPSIMLDATGPRPVRKVVVKVAV
jgi:YhcH/YjgK/YiaL family protein